MESALKLMNKQLVGCRRHYSHLQQRSPTADLEDNLVATFVRLDQGLLSKPDNPSTKISRSSVVRPSFLNIDYAEDFLVIPKRFKDIAEARIYVENIQFMALPQLAHEFGVQVQESPKILDPMLKDLCDNIHSQLSQWNSAFDSLFAEACTQIGSKNLIPASMLKVQVSNSGALGLHPVSS